MPPAVWVSADGPDRNGPMGPEVCGVTESVTWLLHPSPDLILHSGNLFLRSLSVCLRGTLLLAFSKLPSGLPPQKREPLHPSGLTAEHSQARGQHMEQGPTWQAGALVGGVSRRAAGAPILAG